MICKILSPEKTTIYENVLAVSLPGFNGQLQVLPQHAELFQQLKKGHITIEKANGEPEIFDIIEGTCHHLGNILTIVI